MKNYIDTIMLYDENGVETEFQVVVKFDIEEDEYVIVSPMDAQDDDFAIALKIVKEEDGSEAFQTVEDENEFEMVAEAYNTLFSEDVNQVRCCYKWQQ